MIANFPMEEKGKVRARTIKAIGAMPVYPPLDPKGEKVTRVTLVKAKAPGKAEPRDSFVTGTWKARVPRQRRNALSTTVGYGRRN